MSIYTTELRFICETLAGLDESAGYNDSDTVIEKARPKLFSFDFPIYDESYRSILETKIIKHYYFREIGAETYGLFKFWLDTKLNEIMPYYNQLYKTAVIEFNPLYTFDVYKTGNRDGSGDSVTKTASETSGTRTDDLTENVNATAWNKFSDTPQGTVSNIENDTYLTSATKDTDERQRKNTGTQKNTGSASGTDSTNYKNLEEYTEHVYGKNDGRSYSELIAEFRKNILNIDLMVINELEDLFFKLW